MPKWPSCQGPQRVSDLPILQTRTLRPGKTRDTWGFTQLNMKTEVIELVPQLPVQRYPSQNEGNSKSGPINHSREWASLFPGRVGRGLSLAELLPF